jgi:hypothetical protein
MVRFTLLCLLGTVGLLVLSSLLNGLTVVWSDAQFGAALLYLAGMVLLLTGIVSAIAELLSALDVVEAETRLVAELAETADDVFAAPDGSDPPTSATREAP